MNYLTPPVSRDDFLRAAYDLVLPENVPQTRDKPRASGICSDAREIAYSMAGVVPTNPTSLHPDRYDSALTQEQGRHMEELYVKLLAQAGQAVAMRQLELPRSYPVTGHPDGMLVRQGLAAVAYDGVGTWSQGAELDDGLVWGVEFKHYGRYKYESLIKEGLEQAAPDVLAQTSLYGDALGWDACLLIVVSQDASAVRGDATRNRKAKNPANRWADKDFNAKCTFFPIDLRPLKETLVPMLKGRAQFFIDWMENDGDPTHVAWESEPTAEKFPWSWSPYLDLAIKDGQGKLVAPSLPWMR